MALNSSNAPLTSPTSTGKPQPSINHHISNLTATFLDAIQEEDSFELNAAINQYTRAMDSDPDFHRYDHFNICEAHKTAVQILNSLTAASTQLLASPPNSLIHFQTTSPPSASFKPPNLVTENWSGQSYDFYPWLSSVLNGFSLTRCDDPVKRVLTLQAIPLNKIGSLNNIND